MLTASSSGRDLGRHRRKERFHITQRSMDHGSLEVGNVEHHLASVLTQEPSSPAIAFHPICDIFPPMLPEEFNAVILNLKKGIIEPLWTDQQGLCLERRDLYLAYQEVGIDPEFRVWTGQGEADLILFVLSLQKYNPRKLTPIHRVVLALNLLPIFEAEARKRERAGRAVEVDPGKNFSQGRATQTVAKLVGTNSQYVKALKALREQDTALYQAVVSGELKLYRAMQQLKQKQGQEAKPTWKQVASELEAQLQACRAALSRLQAQLADAEMESPATKKGQEGLPQIAENCDSSTII
ncbi:hypothetical protein [Anthocerotibacter panamensis]|uniref:hypothetical protein n=1 Tax=Anthocerotibacter panamensis TaxID=2857077 RepID=UPI001C404B98|nr:hypothetical protein [Anthocerotibacter panamensis]